MKEKINEILIEELANMVVAKVADRICNQVQDMLESV